MKKLFLLIFIFSFFSHFHVLAQTQGLAEIKKVDHVLLIEVESSINPATLNFMERAYDVVKSQKLDLLIIKLNTPGGLISTTKKIITLMNQQAIPSVIWISPPGASATSAGALIASGAHFVFMDQGTNIGAATPVSLGKSLEKEDDIRNKAINDLVSMVESLSSMRNRKANGYTLMVKEAKSFTNQQALKQELINDVVKTQDDLFKNLNGKKTTILGKVYQLEVQTPKVTLLQMDLGQRILNIFSEPGSAYILFLIGAALIYLELQAPGGFIAGSIGALSLILSAIGFQVLPINYGAFALLLLAFCLFIIEVFVTSYGILSIAGLISLVSGSLFLFRTDDAYLHFSHELIFSATAAVFFFLLFLGYIISRDHKNIGKEKFNDLEEKEAKIIKLLSENPSQKEYIYQVKVNGEFWRAKSSIKYPEDVVIKVKKENHDLILNIVE